MRIALIGGTGKEGFGLAVRWARTGQSVVIGSRAAAKAAEAAAQAAEVARQAVDGRTNREAAAGADVVVLTIPYAGQQPILEDLRPVVRGKTVVDATIPLRQYAPPVLAVPPEGSSAQHVQAALAEATVVAAMHTVSSVSLRRYDQPLQEDVLVCGDDPAAKQQVIDLMQLLGLRGLDAGSLAVAPTLEQLGALLIGMTQRAHRKAIGIRLTGF